MSYKLLDCGDRKKLEQFGNLTLIRPAPQALWAPKLKKQWQNADFEFIRDKGESGFWKTLGQKTLPENWTLESDGLKWNLQFNEFGNIGIFTEHWTYAGQLNDFFDPTQPILNLFSYSGSSVMKLMKDGYKVAAVDASKNAMSLYTKNLELNGIARDGQRLVLEDTLKFCQREMRRGNRYNSIICDMPSFGRGTKGEVFDIDQHILEVLETCKALLTSAGRLLITMHSPRYTLATITQLLETMFEGKEIRSKEILNPCQSGLVLPSGSLFLVG